MLKRIESLEEYFSLTKEAKSLYGPLNSTNIFLFGEALNKFILARPYYEIIEGGICFYRELEDMYQMYYAINKNLEYIKTPKAKCIVELLGKSKDRVLEQGRILEKNGFSFLATNKEMERDISNIGKEPLSKTPLVKASEKDVNHIIDLWANHLDLRINPLPLVEDVLKNIENGEIYVLKDKNNEIMATINIYLENKICFFERLVIKSQYQSMGIGKQIIEYCLRIPDTNTIRCFISSNNLGAIGFYKKILFTYTSKISVQYFKE